ncbi:MAG TPA: hypothetical protein VEZ48_14090 [Sphingomonadaceae bacterium]|nr:hypothetical protein [Sphingomonadaceae bacterium]
MTIDPKPGNQPDPDDMSNPFDHDGEATDAPTTHPDLAEDELARLGDFA